MSELSGGTFAIDQIDYITENDPLVVAAVAFEVFAFDKSMRMRGIDLYRIENDKIQEVWLFSEHIDERTPSGQKPSGYLTNRNNISPLVENTMSGEGFYFILFTFSIVFV